MKDNQLQRVPQDIAYDYTAFERAFGDDGKLIKDILIFLSGMQMKNLFHEITFELSDFCQQMGYERTNLQRKLSKNQMESIFNKTVPILESNVHGNIHKHVIETIFESALWRAMKENILFSRKNSTGGFEVKSIQLIDNLHIDYNKLTNKRTRS